MRRCARASGRRTAREASDAPAKTITWIATPAPIAAAIADATAATAIGPRKNSPGVKIYPTASPTATIAHATHAAIRYEV
jgi:hypothetical protein